MGVLEGEYNLRIGIQCRAGNLKLVKELSVSDRGIRGIMQIMAISFRESVIRKEGLVKDCSGLNHELNHQRKSRY